MPTDLAGALKQWILAECQTEFRADLATDPIAVQRISEAAAKAAQSVSPTQPYEINLPFLFADRKGPHHFRRKITYDLAQSLPG